MTAQIDRAAPTMENSPRIYPPGLLAQMQDLLAEIADLNWAHETHLEAAKRSSYPDALKAELIDELKRQYHEQHAPIVTELESLERKMAQELRL